MNKKEFLFPFDFYFSSNREKERTNKQIFMYNYFLHFISCSLFFKEKELETLLRVKYSTIQ